MITEGKWVLGKEDDAQEDAVKNVRIVWEGLFFGKDEIGIICGAFRLLAL
jgi:hypothetical protein